MHSPLSSLLNLQLHIKLHPVMKVINISSTVTFCKFLCIFIGFHMSAHVGIAADICKSLSFPVFRNILNLPKNVIYANFMVHKIALQHSTAEAFVCTTNIHMLTMPPKRKTPEEVSSMITTLTQENLAEIQNTKLDIRFKKFQDEQIKLEAFEVMLGKKKQ